MSLRIFLLGIGFLTLISLVSLVLILTLIDPYNTTTLSPILFFLSFFVAAAGLFILAGFYLRKLFIKNKVSFRLLRTSFRQGILISIVFVSFLIVRSFGVLTWWSGGIIVLIIIILEIFLRKKK